jgi:Amt family ammonium transporter
MYLIEWFRIDDPVGAVSVHGFCGIWGTISLGLFASGDFGATGPAGADNSAPVTGLLYGGGFKVLEAQLIGSAVITVATFAVAFSMMYIINKLPNPWRLRVEEHGEAGLGGLDVFDHGIEVYPPQDDDVSLSGLFDKGIKLPAEA